MYRAVVIDNQLDNIEVASQNILLLYKICMNIGSITEYKIGIDNIKEMYEQFVLKILIKFKEAFWQLDLENLKKYLKIINKFEIMDKVSEFYIDYILGNLKMYSK